MNAFTPIPQILKTRTDIARLYGLPSEANPAEIASAFGRASRYDAWIEIRECPILLHDDEIWEVKVRNEKPLCLMALRQGSRGEWLQQGEDVPQAVLAHFDARIQRDGTIASRRPWGSWVKLRWLGMDGRRLTSKAGEIRALVRVPKVARPTGQIQTTLLIEPLGAPCPERIAPVVVSLPAPAAAIGAALSEIRHLCQRQVLEA